MRRRTLSSWMINRRRSPEAAILAANPPMRGLRRRRQLIEQLEQRVLLAIDSASPWHNGSAPLDVNDDGYVSAIDALLIINDLNGRGGGPLDQSAPSANGQPRASRAAGVTPTFLDVDGDGYSSATDALLVINQLNAQAAAPVEADTPTIGIPDVALREPPHETQRDFVFLVSLTNPSDTDITYTYQTVDGTARAVDGDYDSANGQITVPANTINPIQEQVIVKVYGDSELNEAEETFRLQILDIAGSEVAFATGRITEFTPKLSITSVSKAEGDDFQTTNFDFVVSLDSARDVPVTVRVITTENTASDLDGDFGFVDAEFTFEPGQTSLTVTVTVIGDNFYEDDNPNDDIDKEDFFVDAVLLTGFGNEIPSTQVRGTGTILDDDRAKLEDLTLIGDGDDEGDPGFGNLLEFVLDIPFGTGSKVPLLFVYNTVDGTAIGGVDYQPFDTNEGVAFFREGEAIARVQIYGDSDYERNESFTVLAKLVRADDVSKVIAGPYAAAFGTINNDDAPHLSIENVTKFEGNPGPENFPTAFEFDVTLSPTPFFGESFDVKYYTFGLTATSDVDFRSIIETTLTFNSSEPSTRRIVVDVIPDNEEENSPAGLFETFELRGSVYSFGIPSLQGEVVGMGTILDDDGANAPPSVTIASPAPVNENSGPLTLRLNLSEPAPAGAAVKVRITGQSATAGQDYQVNGAGVDPVDVLVTFAEGATTATVNVDLLNDALNEDIETFQAQLIDPQGLALGTATTVVAQILDDDPLPVVTLGAAGGPTTLPINESAAELLIPLTLSAPAGRAVDVPFTLGGTAIANSDYQLPASLVVRFEAGQTTAQIRLVPINDALDEPSETIIVTLGTPLNATLGTQTSVTGVINDDDQPPSVTVVAPLPAREIANTMSFVVRLAAASGLPVSVPFAVEGISAQPGSDFNIATVSPLVFAPGQVEQTISVTLISDGVDETPEQFRVVLQTPTNATLGPQSTAIGTILADNTPAAIIPSVALDEGDVDDIDPFTPFEFDVLVDNPTAQPVRIKFATADGQNADPLANATEIEDYDPVVSVEGSVDEFLELAPGESRTVTVTVNVVHDDFFELDEDFLLQAFLVDAAGDPIGAAIGQGVGTIRDDEGPKLAAIELVELVDPNDEGNAGISANTIVVLLPGTLEGSKVPLSLVYSTQNDTAIGGVFGTPGADYEQVTDRAIPFVLLGGVYVPDEVSINYFGDTTYEDNETLIVRSRVVRSGNITLATLADFTQDIRNDDFPTLSVASISQLEGNPSGGGNRTAFEFEIKLSQPRLNLDQFTVTYQTVDGTAKAGVDYDSTTGSVTFLAGETSKIVTIPVVANLSPQSDRQFFLDVKLKEEFRGDSPQGTVRATGTIQNDDGELPTVSISGPSTIDEEAGSITFVVTRAGTATETVVVPFTVTGGTATAGADFLVPANLTLTFAPGETQQNIVIPIISEKLIEADETFSVTLQEPTNALLKTPFQATATILDDDRRLQPGSISGFVYVDSNNNGLREAGEGGIQGTIIRLVGADFLGRAVTRQVTTGQDGSYHFTNLIAGAYDIREVQPGFFIDGLDKRGDGSPGFALNDYFAAVALEPAGAVQNFNFGEWRLRDEFLTRRLFFTNTAIGQGAQTLRFSSGNEIWLSLDDGWVGNLTLNLLTESGAGAAGITLYGANMQPLQTATGTGAATLNVAGSGAGHYFVRVVGKLTNAQLTINATPLPVSASLPMQDDASELLDTLFADDSDWLED